MNKKLIIGLVVAGIIVITSILIFINTIGDESSNTSNDSTTSTSSTTQLTAVNACNLLTLPEAKALLGEFATEGDETFPSTNDDISIYTCSYINNAKTSPEIRIITVMARSALTHDGLTSNVEAFENGGAARPEGAVAVEGYGKKAFWDPALHQLAVLKDNTWYGIVYGGTNLQNSSLDDAKKVADLLFQ
jgi:hypothetical protein